MRFTVIFPIACSIVAFVLGMLALFAGWKPGHMEDYDVIRLNISMLGHNLIPTPTISGSQPTATSGGIGGYFENLWHNVTSDVIGEINEIGNDVADTVARELGISQWYSLHLMDSCEGMYAPNATSPNWWFNVTNCTDPSPGYHLDLNELIDNELKLGPHDVSLADINWPPQIQENIDKLNKLLLGIWIVYVCGIALSFISLLTSCGAFAAFRRSVTLLNFIIASLAAVAYLAGSIITTVGATTAENAINEFGNKVGVAAYKGQKFMAFSWACFGVMAASCIYWVFATCVAHRETRRSRRSGIIREKPYARHSDEATL